MDTSQVWTRPELIVLGRGAPEESVLCGCKQSKSGKNSCMARGRVEPQCGHPTPPQPMNRHTTS
jgi:hypothetical protein